jgi:FKBP12-rapamycin complex-associated protein
VFRYYSIANKLDDTWFSGAYALSQACMNVFEANGYSRSDALAVNSYSQLTVPASRADVQSSLQSEACSTVFEPRTLPRK